MKYLVATGREKQNESLEGRNNIIKAGGHCGGVSVVNTQNIDNVISIYEKYKKDQMNAQFNFIFPYDCALENGNEYLIVSEELFYTDQFGALLQAAINRRNKCLKTCNFYQYCRGGCNSDAIMYGDIESNNHFACNVFRGIMSHIVWKVDVARKGDDIIQNLFAKKILNLN